mgnify:CR=1 FL=1
MNTHMRPETWFFIVLGVFVFIAVLDLATTLFLRWKGQPFGGLFFGMTTQWSTPCVLSVKFALHGFLLLCFYDEFPLLSVRTGPLVWVYFMGVAYYLVAAIRQRKRSADAGKKE